MDSWPSGKALVLKTSEGAIPAGVRFLYYPPWDYRLTVSQRTVDAKIGVQLPVVPPSVPDWCSGSTCGSEPREQGSNPWAGTDGCVQWSWASGDSGSTRRLHRWGQGSIPWGSTISLLCSRAVRHRAVTL